MEPLCGENTMNEEDVRMLISIREIKAMREVLKGKQTRIMTQPEEMEEQYGSSSSSPWEKEWQVKGK